MSDWLPIIMVIIAAVIIIGNLSTFQKTSKRPLRKKGLNDLEETLPRGGKKSDQKMDTFKRKL